MYYMASQCLYGVLYPVTMYLNVLYDVGRCAAAEAGIEGMRRTNTRAEQVLHTYLTQRID